MTSFVPCSVFGTGFPLFARAMYINFDIGWANSLSLRSSRALLFRFPSCNTSMVAMILNRQHTPLLSYSAPLFLWRDGPAVPTFGLLLSSGLRRLAYSICFAIVLYHYPTATSPRRLKDTLHSKYFFLSINVRFEVPNPMWHLLYNLDYSLLSIYQ
jgi:hypothetical protein